MPKITVKNHTGGQERNAEDTYYKANELASLTQQKYPDNIRFEMFNPKRCIAQLVFRLN